MNEFVVNMLLSIREDGRINLDTDREVSMYELMAMSASLVEIAMSTYDEPTEEKRKLLKGLIQVLDIIMCEEL